ncbi:FAD-dependent monooxygenase [Cellulomonas chengniuliangii]|uniref:FAD-dependent monooxygenase n=1 Tax=Cellulomonas chengniuliangii TaxID=2968084 RepID=A0ABY5KW12_9CELL|nr:FAD-dependent monooxygenase [Cellulomonas chengniuliangii]MCC2308858.1 FAD-dependent monooxygenase [Cellulomonas chengniuliangii]UUI74399.1 FAD-dependent monooxygenase [Cellulomonas chengniuliangii]
MRAVVVGGGVAGPAVGLALHRAGIESVVLERRAVVDAGEGSYLTVAPNGLDALATLGSREAVEREGFRTRSNIMQGASGRRLGQLSLAGTLARDTGALTLRRSRLAATLTTRAQRSGVEVRLGARVARVEPGAAVLDDGDRVRADVIIGADGVHSLVRSAIDPEAPAGRYVGLTNFGGVTRGTPLARTLPSEAWLLVFGARAFFGAHPTPDGDVIWFVNVPRPLISRQERAATTETQWHEHLHELLRDDAGPAGELIAHGELELAGDNTIDLPHVPTWSRDGMVVVGDAAHAPSPSSGQGASLALEDSVVLAQALRDAPDVPTALAAYERVRRPRVERVVAAGARSGKTKVAGPIGRRLQDLLMPLVFRLLVTDRSTAWMYDHRIPWDDRVA